MKELQRRRVLAWLLSICMVLSIFMTHSYETKAEGSARLEFIGATKVADNNAVQFTVDGFTWTVTVSGLGAFEWKLDGSNPELLNIPAGNSLTFTLSGGDASATKPKMDFGGDTMSFEENTITKAFDATSGGPHPVDLVSGAGGGSGSGGGNQDPPQTNPGDILFDITNAGNGTVSYATTNTEGTEWTPVNGNNVVVSKGSLDGATKIYVKVEPNPGQSLDNNKDQMDGISVNRCVTNGNPTELSFVENVASVEYDAENKYQIQIRFNGGGTGPQFGSLEFSQATKVDGENAVKFVIDNKEYKLGLSTVDNSEWRTLDNGNAEWVNIPSGTNITYTLTLPEGVTKTPSFYVDNAPENLEEGSVTRTINFGPDHNHVMVSLGHNSNPNPGDGGHTVVGPIEVRVNGTNQDKVTNPVCKINGETENLPNAWPQNGEVSLAVQVAEGYEIVPSTVSIAWQYLDEEQNRPNGPRLNLTPEQQEAIANKLTTEAGYTFTGYNPEDYQVSYDLNPYLSIEFEVNKVFEHKVGLHFYKQEADGMVDGEIVYRDIRPATSANDMEFEDFRFNGNALTITEGHALAGGYSYEDVAEGASLKNVLEFFEGFGTSVDKIYLAKGNVLDPSEMEEVQSYDKDMGDGNHVKAYRIELPPEADCDEYSILAVYGLSDDLNLKWSYMEQDRDRDYFVEHGKVFVDKIERHNEEVYNPSKGIDPGNIVSLETYGGEVAAQRGDVITLRLVPDAGYQLKSASLNGSELEAQEEVSTFIVEMQSNLHFAGTFDEGNTVVQVEDSAGVDVGLFELGTDEQQSDLIETGTLGLVVEKTDSGYDVDAAIGELEEAAEPITVLDIGLENFVYKGTFTDDVAADY